MRIHVVLLLGIFAFAMFSLFNSQASADPAETAQSFLASVKSGDVTSALMEFGDNTCHCAPDGGYASYLNYEGAHDPNLAFLVGQRFEIGKPITKQLPMHTQGSFLPWDKPEDVAVFIPVQFNNRVEMPYFLPMDSAFGHNETEAEYAKFKKDPTFEWMRAFTLRLRPTLETGFIKVPDKVVKPPAGEVMIVEKDLPPEVLKYLHPKDPGSATMADGKQVPMRAIESELPRLKSIIVGFKVVRRGMMQRWTIQKIGVQDGVLLAGQREFKLAEQDTQSALKLAPNR